MLQTIISDLNETALDEAYVCELDVDDDADYFVELIEDAVEATGSTRRVYKQGNTIYAVIK